MMNWAKNAVQEAYIGGKTHKCHEMNLQVRLISCFCPFYGYYGNEFFFLWSQIVENRSI